jgi:hypothetical protein
MTVNIPVRRGKPAITIGDRLRQQAELRVRAGQLGAERVDGAQRLGQPARCDHLSDRVDRPGRDRDP